MAFDWFFQVSLLAAYLTLLTLFFREKLSVTSALTIAATASLLLVACFARSAFHILRLFAWILFAHGPFFLLLYAWWRRGEPRKAVPAALVSLSLLLVAFNAFLVEPHALEINRHRLRVPALTRAVRIVVLADIQTDAIGPYEKRVFDEVAELQPDVLLLPGDFLQVYGPERPAQEERLRQLFQGVQPKLGIWAVRGNVDPLDTGRIFEGTQVRYVEETSVLEVSDQIALVALSLEDSFDSNFQVPPAELPFRIVMGHAPDFSLGTSRGAGASLYIAGHTHGGQVQLPFFGPPLTLSKVPRAWGGGDLVRLSEQRTLIVSRGIGMEREYAPRLRFLCRPELVVVDVHP